MEAWRWTVIRVFKRLTTMGFGAGYAQAIAKSKFRNVPNFGQKMTTLLLLQDHGDPVWFRNLKIRPLKK